LGGMERVQRLITIASPHQGTKMAYLSPRPGCVQMRPGSKFLEDLNQDATMLERLNFTSIWTPWDYIIVPASSSQMPVGREVKVPVFAHAMMVRDLRSLQAVASALSEPYELPPVPTAQAVSDASSPTLAETLHNALWVFQ